MTEIVRVLARNNVGVVQMSCPELAYAGLSRVPKTREQYDNLKFRKLCRKIAEELVKQVSEYPQHEIKLKVVIALTAAQAAR